jgi:hypothetical protein
MSSTCRCFCRNSENFRMCGWGSREWVVVVAARAARARGGSIREAGRIKDLRSRV